MSADTFAWLMFAIFLLEGGAALGTLLNAKFPMVVERTKGVYVSNAVLNLTYASLAWWALHS